MKPTPAGTTLSHHSKARVFWDSAIVTSGEASTSILTLMHPWHPLAAVRSMVNVRDRVTQEGVQSWWNMNNSGGGERGG